MEPSVSAGEAGPATAAAMNGPSGLCIDAANNVYVADSDNAVIREMYRGRVGQIHRQSSIRLPASSKPTCYGGDGAAARARPPPFPGRLLLRQQRKHVHRRPRQQRNSRRDRHCSRHSAESDRYGHCRATSICSRVRPAPCAPGPPAVAGYGARRKLPQVRPVYGPFDVFVDSHDNVFYADLGNNFPGRGQPNNQPATF